MQDPEAIPQRDPKSSSAGDEEPAAEDALAPAPAPNSSVPCTDLERVERIGEFWSSPQSRGFAELLIDCEEDRVVRAVLVGMLREMERRG